MIVTYLLPYFFIITLVSFRASSKSVMSISSKNKERTQLVTNGIQSLTISINKLQLCLNYSL